MVPVLLSRGGHGHAHRAGLDSDQRQRADRLARPRRRRRDAHRLRGCGYLRVDRRRRPHGRAGRTPEGADDPAPARPLHHLRLRARRAARRRGVPGGERSLRRRRLPRGRGRRGAGGRGASRRGRRDARREPAQGGPRARAGARGGLRLRRGQPLRRPLGPRGASRPHDRRARLRRRRRAEARPRRRRPDRAPVHDRGTGDGEPRAQAAGDGVPRHRDDGDGPRPAARRDRGSRDLHGGRANDPRPAHPARDGSARRLAAEGGRQLRHDAGAGHADRGRRRADRRRLAGRDPGAGRPLRSSARALPADPVRTLAAALADAAGAELELERPGEPEHGDYATNVALQLAGARRRPPREIAAEIAQAAAGLEVVERAEVAGPGFVNLFLRDEWFSSALAEILEDGDAYGGGAAGERERVQVEMVSANPTGPIPVAVGPQRRLRRLARPPVRRSPGTRSSASTTTTTRARRWTGSARRSRRCGAGRSRPRTAIRAPTSTSSPP